MKSVIKATIFLLMVTVLLVGCSGSPTAAPTASDTTATPADYPPPTTGPAADTPDGYPAPGSTDATAAPTPVGYPAAGQGDTPAAPPEEGYPAAGQSLMVSLPGGVNKPLALDALNGLATATVNIEGKDQSLRKLADVLNLAGATAFTKVTATGESGDLTITSDQVAQAYLDISADGKLRLLVQGVDPAQWPTGVTALTVE